MTVTKVDHLLNEYLPFLLKLKGEKKNQNNGSFEHEVPTEKTLVKKHEKFEVKK